MSIYKIVALVISVILMVSFTIGGIHHYTTGDDTFRHPGSTVIRLICAFALLVDVIAASLVG